VAWTGDGRAESRERCGHPHLQLHVSLDDLFREEAVVWCEAWLCAPRQLRAQRYTVLVRAALVQCHQDDVREACRRHDQDGLSGTRQRHRGAIRCRVSSERGLSRRRTSAEERASSGWASALRESMFVAVDRARSALRGQGEDA
jgi:hypothetical protein